MITQSNSSDRLFDNSCMRPEVSPDIGIVVGVAAQAERQALR